MGINVKAKHRIISIIILVAVISAAASFPASAKDSSSSVNICNCSEVYVGGMPFGIKLYTDGLLVVGFSDVECSTGSKTPAIDAGIKIGDIITEVNGTSVSSSKDFATAVESTNGEINVVYLRDNKKHEVKIIMSLSNTDGKYKTGMWLRDSAAGIGTVTFTVPDTNEFAGLGHGICDTETGDLLPIVRGVATEARITGVKIGTPGEPGELRGYFTSGKSGVILKNTSCGVFGIMSEEKINPLMTNKVSVGERSSVQLGDACIFCTVDGEGPQKYEIRITKVPSSSDISNFEIEITDSALIEKTGGIVQGMSGSPIVQNGKIIGAVTHVLISEPTRGYGIFIENMLESANSVAEDNKQKEAS